MNIISINNIIVIIILLLAISICNSYITSSTLSSSLYNHYTHNQHPSCLNVALSTMPQADLTPAVDKFLRLPVPGLEKVDKYFMRFDYYYYYYYHKHH